MISVQSYELMSKQPKAYKLQDTVIWYFQNWLNTFRWVININNKCMVIQIIILYVYVLLYKKKLYFFFNIAL